MSKKIYYILLLLTSIISVYLGFNSTIIPDIILYLIILIYVIILGLILLLLRSNKKKKKKKKKRHLKKKIRLFFITLLSLIAMIMDIGLCLLYFRTNNFFNRITNVKFETNNYSVIVLKESTYTTLDEIKTIGLYGNLIDKSYEEAKKELKSKATIENKDYDSIIDLINDLYNQDIDSIFINENYIELINENDEEFKDNIRKLDTITIKSLNEKNSNNDINLNKLESFNIYISGIDTYGEISNVSRSDVNIIATVNLKESKILLTNTPRDYYVQLAGTTGNKDKLTHAGMYGINTSIKTLEQLYDIKINYYVRVNFNTLITLVDSIGGIDIYSDAEFVPYTDRSVYVKYGWNHFSGKEALAYSRERMTYSEGDRHRGQNQQQVIEAIMKKVTKSRDINTYLNLLTVLEKSIQTNMNKKLINNFINLQIKNNYDWSFESIGVTGYDSGNYTYSYPGQYLYVMEPDNESVDVAKEKIKEMLK